MVRTHQMARGSTTHPNICCCYYTFAPGILPGTKHYLPQVKLSAHTNILSTVSRTRLNQTFINGSADMIKEAIYMFPLYDGVSVVAFTCQIGNRVIKGIVKERQKAKDVFKSAADRGETAGLLEQLSEASDVFTSTIANISAGEEVHVAIDYLSDLKHDAEVDGIRFTLPTVIAPRYGTLPGSVLGGGGAGASTTATEDGGIKITIDVTMTGGTFIRGIQSPSHPIAVSMGTTSTAPNEDPLMCRASATLALGSAELEKDFVLLVLAKESASPTAVLETHPTIPDQRALMTTLVPKFNLKNIFPEIVFVADRSGSMEPNEKTLVSALKVFLKSLPVGVKFNICSFGSRYSFLWPKSKAYDAENLRDAMSHVQTFDASFGGTEMLQPIQETIKRRYNDLALEVILLTDGEIWAQEQLFSYINKEVGDTEAPIRWFTLGIGDSVSHALIEGIARAGNGFAQVVGNDEKLEHKVVRSLKGALSPHVTDYNLEVKYGVDGTDNDDEVERVTDSLRVTMRVTSPKPDQDTEQQKPISLFNVNADPDKERTPPPDDSGQGRYDHLQPLSPPKLLQAPYKIPPLFPFMRSTVYLLLSPRASQKSPKSVILKATSPQGPLELEIPIQTLGEPDETIHQLAAKKAIGELEEGRGWIFDAKDEGGVPIKERFEGRFDEMVQREAVRLGVDFQVGGKWCSFVAVEQNDKELEEKARKAKAAADAKGKKESQKMLLDDKDSLLSRATPSEPETDLHDAAISENWDNASLASSTVSTGTRVSASTDDSNAHLARSTCIPMSRGQFGGGSSRGALFSSTSTLQNTPFSATSASNSSLVSTTNASKGAPFGPTSASMMPQSGPNVKYDAASTQALQQQYMHQRQQLQPGQAHQQQAQRQPQLGAPPHSASRKRVSQLIDVEAEIDEDDEAGGERESYEEPEEEQLFEFPNGEESLRQRLASIAARARPAPVVLGQSAQPGPTLVHRRTLSRSQPRLEAGKKTASPADKKKRKTAATTPNLEPWVEVSIGYPSTTDTKSPQVESFKSYRISMDTPCRDILPAALRKYNITGDPKDYDLRIVYADQEQSVEPEEIPLAIFKQLEKEGKKPMFMLKKKQTAVPEEVGADFIELDEITEELGESFENYIESLGDEEPPPTPPPSGVDQIKTLMGINRGNKKPPRKQLASKAAHRSPPAPYNTQMPPSQRAGGGTFVHQSMAAEAGAEADSSDDEDMGFGLFDGSPAPTAKTDGERLHLLIALQSFDGCWELDSSLCNCLSISIETAESKLDELLESEGQGRAIQMRKVWASILAIAFFEKILTSEREAWELVVDKARLWLEGQVGMEEGRVGEWERVAVGVVDLPAEVL
ncbi:MAG: hypothetical protein M1836_001447 [Candelina mexicana]|nr:MAG: hypothetical protein M1836_001447 [Candelina mexicana]